MNLKDFFMYLGHVLGLMSGNDTTTDLSTVTFPEASTPIVLDTSTFRQYRSSHPAVSTKILSTLFSEKEYETTTNFPNSKTMSVKETTEPSPTQFFSTNKGITGQAGDLDATTDNGLNITSTEGEFNGTSENGLNITSTDGEFNGTTDGGFNITSTEREFNGTTEGEFNITSTEGDFNGTTEGGFNVTSTPGDFNGTTDSGVNITSTEGGSTDGTSAGTQNTNDSSTNDGSDGTTQSSPVTGTTEAAPTKKPGLTKGAVAGIVIGCLLAVALVTAAVVFVVKQRGNPETRRLNP